MELGQAIGVMDAHAGQNPYGREADVPSPKSNVLLIPKGFAKTCRIEAVNAWNQVLLLPGSLGECRRGWLPITPFPTEVKVVIVADNASSGDEHHILRSPPMQWEM